MKYTIVSGSNILQLEDAVNDLIKKGWIPQGGFKISHDNLYHQAMILKE